MQKDGKNLVLNQAFHVRRRARQHLVQIQRCIDFLADFSQNRQRLRRDLHLRIESSCVHLNFWVVRSGIGRCAFPAGAPAYFIRQRNRYENIIAGEELQLIAPRSSLTRQHADSIALEQRRTACARR